MNEPSELHAANVVSVKAQSIAQLVDAGYERQSVVRAVDAGDLALLKQAQ